jgi:hypothetical protein
VTDLASAPTQARAVKHDRYDAAGYDYRLVRGWRRADPSAPVDVGRCCSSPDGEGEDDITRLAVQ